MTSIARLGRFTIAVFPPQVYVTYGVLWALALEGSAAVLARGSWRPSGATAVRAVSVVLALLYLRIADEQKDLEYDRVHHPQRPLVRGEVSHRELRVAMAAIALLLTMLNVWLAPVALTVLLADLVYAVALMAAEDRSKRLRDNLLLNLFITYPVQLALSFYVYVSAATQSGAWAGWRAIPLVAIFVCVFLHFEFARKTAWTIPSGARLYSGVLGARRSAHLAAGFAIAAVLLTLALFRPWQVRGLTVLTALLPYAALAFPAAGLRSFLRRRRRAWPLPAAMAFVVASYLALTIQAGAR
jgi:hypothetical protein